MASEVDGDSLFCCFSLRVGTSASGLTIINELEKKPNK